MNLSAIQPVLKAQVAAWTGIPAHWEDEPRPFGGPGIALLSIPAIVGLGRDEAIQSQDLGQDLGQELQSEYRGVRLVTLTIKVEALDWTAGKTAQAYLEAARTRAFWASSRDALAAVNVAPVRAMSPVDLSEARDGHRVNVASLDLVLAVRTSEVDPARYGYVATVDLVPDFK